MTYLACIWLSVHVTGSGPYFYHVGSHLDHLPPRLWHILAYGVFRVGVGWSASDSDKKKARLQDSCALLTTCFALLYRVMVGTCHLSRLWFPR